MKKFVSVVLFMMLVLSTTACSQNSNESNSETSSKETISETVSSQTVSSEAESKENSEIESTSETDTESADKELSAESIKALVETNIEEYEFEGIVYLTKNGEVLYQSASGVGENEESLTVETPMPLGSVSKQFCAVAVLMLNEQGKLSLDDTLDKYYPKYEDGKKITIKNLLSMRTGIRDMVNEGTVQDMSADNDEATNTAAIEEWIFSQSLKFNPDEGYAYSNSNYFLLANIVEKVSGQKYFDFISENIFIPLGMNNTGSVEEVKNSPEWAKGIDLSSVEDGKIAGLTKGAGDIVSTAHDMDIWMTALQSGKIISEESYIEMTTNQSPEYPSQYGYGLELDINGFTGHMGAIATYTAGDYFSEESGYNLFVASNNLHPIDTTDFAMDILTGLCDN